jgi:hypothetical protein
MSDIVKRLQAPAYWISGSNEGHEGENDAPREAAAEIERLRAALMSLIEQISMADGITGKIIIRQKSLDKAALLRALYEARAALSGKGQG